MVSVVIHCNPQLQHQVDFARALEAGFSRHGVDAGVTSSRTLRGDLHVVLGPWYALAENKHRRILYLDRCFYGDARWTVSLSWLMAGRRDFRNHGMASPKGTLPILRPRKESRRCAVVFGDYRRDASQDIHLAREQFNQVTFRPHPAQFRSEISLEELWETTDVAIGHSSTVLVEAELNGLHVQSTDPFHVCQGIEDREQWLTDLSWAQWNINEVKRGEFWEHLR